MTIVFGVLNVGKLSMSYSLKQICSYNAVKPDVKEGGVTKTMSILQKSGEVSLFFL